MGGSHKDSSLQFIREKRTTNTGSLREAACLPNSAEALFAVWEEWPQPNATVVMCALLSTQWTQKYDTSLNILQIVQPRLAVNARVTTILTRGGS